MAYSFTGRKTRWDQLTCYILQLAAALAPFLPPLSRALLVIRVYRRFPPLFTADRVVRLPPINHARSNNSSSSSRSNDDTLEKDPSCFSFSLVVVVSTSIILILLIPSREGTK